MSTIAFSATFKATDDGVTIDLVPAISKTISAAEKAAFLLSIPTATTDSAVNFGTVASAKALYLEPDGVLTMKLNGGSQTIPLGAGPCLLFSTTGYTALSLTNASGSTVTVKVVILGA